MFSILFFSIRKYQNAVHDDLWEAMSNVSNIETLELPASIKTIMSSWSLQTGYPIVTIRRNYDTQSAIVTQVKAFSKSIGNHILTVQSFFMMCY